MLTDVSKQVINNACHMINRTIGDMVRLVEPDEDDKALEIVRHMEATFLDDWSRLRSHYDMRWNDDLKRVQDDKFETPQCIKDIEP